MVVTKDYRLTINDIDWSCPSDLEPYILAFKQEEKLIDHHNWMLGLYIQNATYVAIEHALQGNKAKSEYIKEAMLSKIDEDDGLSQEEIDNKELRKMLFAEEQWQKVAKRKGLPEI